MALLAIARSRSSIVLRFGSMVAGVVFAIPTGACGRCAYSVTVTLPPAADPTAPGCTGCPAIDGLDPLSCSNLGGQGRLCTYETHGYEDDPRSRFVTLPSASCGTCNPSNSGGLVGCVGTKAGPGCVFALCND